MRNCFTMQAKLMNGYWKKSANNRAKQIVYYALSSQLISSEFVPKLHKIQHAIRLIQRKTRFRKLYFAARMYILDAQWQKMLDALHKRAKKLKERGDLDDKPTKMLNIVDAISNVPKVVRKYVLSKYLQSI